ncbi:hypothetical protein KC973_00950 [Candidatus Saccharibacteria bacterium]|nr:hypothetical protein [Candidatus Saccharibacteria bacterium]
MQSKELYEFLFKLYDYADVLADRIKPGNFDNFNYLMALILIEDYFDGIGRGEIRSAAEAMNDAGVDPSKALSEAHRRIDLLRARIRTIVDQYDFDDQLRRATERIATDWQKRV